jgi:hypothetical protein
MAARILGERNRMALTKLRQKWIADVLGVDMRKFAAAPGGQGAPAAAPVPPRPDADAKSPAPADQAKKVEITIDNRSDRTLRFIKADSDGGRFDPPPPQRIAPKKKVSFSALDTGAKGGTLIYQLEAKDGAAEEPDQLPWWHMSWKPMQAGQLPQQDSKLDPELKGYSPSEAAGKDAIAFMLAGASAATQAAAKPPAPQASPAAGQRRIDVTFANQSDRWLKYWGADKMTATFDQKPPDELKPGASATFAIFAKGSGEIHFGLMYSILPAAAAKADADTAKWTPHFTIPAGTAVMVPGSDIVPGIDGLKSSANPGSDAVSFVLSGKAAASVQPAQAQEQRIPITFTNNSNMVLRYWGADKMVVTFDQKPPDFIKPGQSLGFAVRGKRGSGIRFGLMYSILANETEKAEKGTPKWTPHFQIPPGGNMIADCQVLPGMGGLKAGGWPEKDGALFALSGHWAKDQELKTPISIKNATPYKLRLAQSSAAPGRFDPAAPAEIAPGATATCASWAKVESDQKLVYELEAADGAGEAGRASPKRKPKRWTLTWHTKPGDGPRVDSQLENVKRNSGGWGLDGDDGVSFELEIKDDAEPK